MCVDNTETLQQAKSLSRELTKISNAELNAILNVWASAVKNYREWLVDDYKLKWH
jgi:hypothetical protein